MSNKNTLDIIDELFTDVITNSVFMDQITPALHKIREQIREEKRAIEHLSEEILSNNFYCCPYVCNHDNCNRVKRALAGIESEFRIKVQSNDNLPSPVVEQDLHDYYEPFFNKSYKRPIKSTKYKHKEPAKTFRDLYPKAKADNLFVNVKASVNHIIQLLNDFYKNLEFGFLIHYNYEIKDEEITHTIQKGKNKGKEVTTQQTNIYIDIYDYTIIPTKIEKSETQLLEKITIYQTEEFFDKSIDEKHPYLGYLHSHNNMGAFHSGTDINTFWEEVKQKDNVLSIVTSYREDWDFSLVLDGLYYIIDKKNIQVQPFVFTNWDEDESLRDLYWEDVLLYDRWFSMAKIKDWLIAMFPEDKEITDTNNINDFFDNMKDFEFELMKRFSEYSPKTDKYINFMNKMLSELEKDNLAKPTKIIYG